MPTEQTSHQRVAVEAAQAVLHSGIDFTKLPDGFAEALALSEESEKSILPALATLANHRNSALLSFIGPYGAKRVSAYRTQSASINPLDEISIERFVSEVRRRAPADSDQKPDLLLLLNTLGGAVNSSYAIAKMLRQTFSRIVVVIPHIAASGGTLISLAANELLMGINSRLSPIDTQVAYRDGRVSAQSIDRAIVTLTQRTRRQRMDEVSFVDQELVGRLDPILWEEWKATLYQMGSYAKELMTSAGFQKEAVDAVIYSLLWTPYPHDFCYDRERVRNDLKLTVKMESDDDELWAVFKSWHSVHALAPEGRHIIRYVLPNTFQPR